MKELTYKTLQAPAQAIYRVMASKHLAYAIPVKSETEIKSQLEALWKEHPQATHICYAWRLGWKKDLYRINDDGEPSGTAGKPIFGQIQSFDLTDVLIAVVRYFGGTKLGTGGLIDAYKTASRMAIEEARIIELEVKDRVIVNFTHADMPHVMRILKELKMEKINADFDTTCNIEFMIRKIDKSIMLSKLEELKNLLITFPDEN